MLAIKLSPISGLHKGCGGRVIQVFRKGNKYSVTGVVPRVSLEEQGAPRVEGWGRCGHAERSKESVPGEGVGRSNRVKKYVQAKVQMTYQSKVAHLSKSNF